MAKQHDSSKFDRLEGHEWQVATQRELVERLRRIVRDADPNPARDYLVADLAAQEQILAELMSPPTSGGTKGGEARVKTAS
ncbi:hypothetical protein D3C87_1084390 [compost metagenome]